MVWLTLGADPRVVSVCSAAQRLNQEDRPCHLVWDPLTGDIAQLLPIVRAGCALGTPEHLDYAPDQLPHRPASVNREGRLCVQIGDSVGPGAVHELPDARARRDLGLARLMADPAALAGLANPPRSGS